MFSNNLDLSLICVFIIHFFDWNNKSNKLSDDQLRFELKKAFFHYIFLAETTEKPDQKF